MNSKLYHFLQGIKWWVWLRFTSEGRDLKQFLTGNNIPDGYAEILVWERGGFNADRVDKGGEH